MNKEESRKLKLRTEEKILLAKAKENLWKRTQERGKDEVS